LAINPAVPVDVPIVKGDGLQNYQAYQLREIEKIVAELHFHRLAVDPYFCD
jgi:hypothetical protein